MKKEKDRDPIDRKLLKRSINRVAQKSRRENKALNLDSLVIKEGNLVRIKPDGSEVVVKKKEQRKSISDSDIDLVRTLTSDN